MPDEDTEALAHEPGQDAVVPVAVRAEWRLRVVDMEAAEPLEPDALVDLLEQPVERPRIGRQGPTGTRPVVPRARCLPLLHLGHRHNAKTLPMGSDSAPPVFMAGPAGWAGVCCASRNPPVGRWASAPPVARRGASRCGAGQTVPPPSPLRIQDLVEQAGDLAEARRHRRRAGRRPRRAGCPGGCPHRSAPRCRGRPVQVHLEPEEVEVQRPQHQVQDVAGRGADSRVGRRPAGDVLDLQVHRLGVRHRPARALQGGGHRRAHHQLAAVVPELLRHDRTFAVRCGPSCRSTCRCRSANSAAGAVLRGLVAWWPWGRRPVGRAGTQCRRRRQGAQRHHRGGRGSSSTR